MDERLVANDELVLQLHNWSVANGELVLQLHNWSVEHDHGLVGDLDARPYGNGVLLRFETDDFDAPIARATEISAEVVMAPHRNQPSGDGGPNNRECWFRAISTATPSCWPAPTARQGHQTAKLVRSPKSVSR